MDAATASTVGSHGNWVATCSDGSLLYAPASTTLSMVAGAGDASWVAITVANIPNAIAAAPQLNSVANVGTSGTANVSFVAGGQNAELVTPTAAETPVIGTWSAPASLPGFPINAVTSGSLSLTVGATPVNIQIAVGAGGLTAYSLNNGVTWTVNPANTVAPFNYNLKAVTCGTQSVGGAGVCDSKRHRLSIRRSYLSIFAGATEHCLW
jgi:hypothetical protein